MGTRNYVAQSASLTLHAFGLLALLFVMNRAAAGVDPTVQPADNKHLVYVASPGIDGGGGGHKAPAPPVEMQIPVARPATVVPVAVVAPIDPLPSITAPVLTNAATVLTATGVTLGATPVPNGGGGNGHGIGPGDGDGPGPGDGTGVGTGRAGEGGISWPQRFREVKPQYTAAAMQRKIQGSVALEAVVGIDGKILSVRVTRSLDAIFGLDEAARQAVFATGLTPCRKAGQPVVCKVPFELQFTLR